jgi:hypothetical protein
MLHTECLSVSSHKHGIMASLCKYTDDVELEIECDVPCCVRTWPKACLSSDGTVLLRAVPGTQ